MAALVADLTGIGRVIAAGSAVTLSTDTPNYSARFDVDVDYRLALVVWVCGDGLLEAIWYGVDTAKDNPLHPLNQPPVADIPMQETIYFNESQSVDIYSFLFARIKAIASGMADRLGVFGTPDHTWQDYDSSKRPGTGGY